MIIFRSFDLVKETSFEVSFCESGLYVEIKNGNEYTNYIIEDSEEIEELAKYLTDKK